MKDSIHKIGQWISDTKEILADLSLENDTSLRHQLAQLEIEHDGLQLTFPEQSVDVNEKLVALHEHHIENELREIIRRALGYYSLIEKPKGQNELLPGHEGAAQILNQLELSNSNITELKDQLFGLMGTPKDNNGPDINNDTDNTERRL